MLPSERLVSVIKQMRILRKEQNEITDHLVSSMYALLPKEFKRVNTCVEDDKLVLTFGNTYELYSCYIYYLPLYWVDETPTSKEIFSWLQKYFSEHPEDNNGELEYLELKQDKATQLNMFDTRRPYYDDNFPCK